MSRRFLFPCLFLTTLGSIAHAQTPHVQGQKTIAGHSLELISGQNGIGVNVLVDGQVIESEGDDMFDSIYGSYVVAGMPIAIIEHGDGGNACPGTFSAVIFGPSISATKEFGSCSDIPTISISGNQLIVNTPKLNGQGSEIDTVTKGGLNAPQSVAAQLGGPDYAPGMDLAAELTGQIPYAPFKLKATADKIKSVVGDQVYSTISQFVEDSFGEPAPLGNYVVDDLCMPHGCGEMATHLVFDHKGNAWVAVNSSGNWTWFGNPPADVIATLASR